MQIASFANVEKRKKKKYGRGGKKKRKEKINLLDEKGRCPLLPRTTSAPHPVLSLSSQLI